MLNVDNPAVNLETRRFLRGLVDAGPGLDEPCLELMERALDRVKAISPSGWVHRLALALGAAPEDALEAASFTELFYAMCSFTDDVQDKDARGYMQTGDDRILVNTLAQLICVTVVRGGTFAIRKGGSASEDLVRAFLDGSAMLRGQRLEILRERWCVQRYRQVAVLSAGRQLDVYFRAAALAAGTQPEPLLKLSDPMGILVQVRHDRTSGDLRLLGLDQDEVTRMTRRSARELARAAAQVPPEARDVIDAMIAFVG